MNEKSSGSRWEPDPDEQVTQRLSTPPTDASIVPGLAAEPSAARPRRFGRGLAAVAIVTAATVAGGAVGMAVVGNRTSQVNDPTTDITGQDGTTPNGASPDGSTQDGTTPDGTVPDGTVPDGGFRQRPGALPDFDDDGFDHHGFGGDH